MIFVKIMDMEITIGDRLTEFMKYKNLGPAEFGRKFGANRKEVNNWQSGTKITVKWVAEISKAYPDLNLHWLLIGEPHKMLNHKDGTGFESKEQRNLKNPADLLREALKQLENMKEI